MPQPDLHAVAPNGGFDGSTYDDARDRRRLARQLTAVRRFMSDGEWHHLSEVAHITGNPEASVSARLRDLRKPRFGGFTIEREYRGDGLYAYRMARADLERAA